MHFWFSPLALVRLKRLHYMVDNDIPEPLQEIEVIGSMAGWSLW
jgi:hypothetical protein